MATSNRERVGRAFELLGPALNHFIQAALGPEMQPGAKWTDLVKAVDGDRAMNSYDPQDPSIGLKMLANNIPHRARPGWYPFRTLARPQTALASILLDSRNQWAHLRPFSTDDAYSTLDAAERLLRAIGAVGDADHVLTMRRDLMRVSSDQQDRRAVRTTGVSEIGSTGLPPWREVLKPHHDVATGNFRAAEFAADLHMVMKGIGDSEYTDPVEFFRRTYLTGGLRDLISRAARRLSGDRNASPVVNLQTNFGGGKTHSMLSLWHLASGRPITAYPQELQELDGVDQLDRIGPIGRVALVGNHLTPGAEDVKPDGTRVRTLWGEMAWQLGRAEGYAIVADADRTSTNPGDRLRQLFERYSPAVVLIDEWVAYARDLYGKEGLPSGSFDTQFTFAQTLTEAAKAVQGVLVVISIPASSESMDEDGGVSDEEVGGENGREALRRLQNVVRRVADQWRQANAEESFEIVRRRLFETPTGEQLSRIAAVARSLVDYYRQHATEFPSRVTDPNYGKRIERSYPVHPELFDRLYEDWSTLDRFQRTRGVLRLMNTVVGTLWQSEDAAPLIMPGSVPLDTDVVMTELTQYLADDWKAIIDADIDGPSSAPARIDAENPLLGQRRVTRRLARTVFIGATPTLSTAHKGLERKNVFLGTALPGDVPGNFHSAINHLSNVSTYFYTEGERCWFDTQANTTRTAKDYAEQLDEENVFAEIARRLLTFRSSRADGFAAVYVAPESSADLPDVAEARLVILSPRYRYSKKSEAGSKAHEWVQQAVERRGNAARTHRNTLLFLALDEARGRELFLAVRDFLAWAYVRDNESTLGLTTQQRNQATNRANTENQTVEDRLVAAYHWVLYPEQPDPAAPMSITALKAEGSQTDLVARTARKLMNEGQLVLVRSAGLFKMDLDETLAAVWSAGHVSVGELWALYTTYPYLARLRDRSVLEDGIRSVDRELDWEQTGFAVASSWDGERYAGLVLPREDAEVPALTDSVLLVAPTRALAQRHKDRPVPTGGSGGPGTGTSDGRGTTPGGGGGPVVPLPPIPERRTIRYFGSTTLDSQFPARDFAKVAAEILQHLLKDGVNLSVTLEIEATSSSGFDTSTERVISENASTLGFGQSQFETD